MPPTAAKRGVTRVDVAAKRIPLVARLALNSAPPGSELFSWVSLEFQVQRELDAPWNVALARHLSKASSTPVRIGGAVEMPVKSIPK
jgi:hypothetical protein